MLLHPGSRGKKRSNIKMPVVKAKKVYGPCLKEKENNYYKPRKRACGCWSKHIGINLKKTWRAVLMY